MAEPILIECPTCSGLGCESCSDGDFSIDGCPNSFCSEMVPAIEMIELFAQGLPPVSGGSLDQSAWFVAAARQFKSEEAQAKAVEE